MHTWISYHFYPLETPEVFLSRAVKPFLAQYIWPTPGARAFFVRFEDEKGFHLRLRLRGERDWVDTVLKEAVAGWFAERGECLEVPYEPEAARFGGADLLVWAEEYFHVSTRVVLERVSQGTYTHGDAMFDALRMQVVAVFAAGLNRAEAARYFEQLSAQWLPLFFRPVDSEGPLPADFVQGVREKFELAYTKQQAQLQPILRKLWEALESGKFDAKHPEWLRWYRGNELILKEFGDQLEKVLPSLLHLTNNRLGINNQDEVFLLYVLGMAGDK